MDAAAAYTTEGAKTVQTSGRSGELTATD